MKEQKLNLFNYTLCKGIETIKMYVAERYPRYMDYAQYHAGKAGIPDESGDVLNEVIISLFSKDFEYLAKLYSTRRNGYTDLDFFILQMLKLNCHSATSPYRHKNRPIPADANVNYRKLNIADEPYEEIDTPAIVLKQFKLVRFVYERLELSELEKKVFEHGFILNNRVVEFNELRPKAFYSMFNIIRDSIHEILYYHKLTSKKPVPRVKGKQRRKELERRKELVSGFLKTRKLIIKHSEN
jgi:hypothetical protein